MNNPPPCIAVASFEGMLVNLHLGEARKLYIYRLQGDTFHLLGTRPTPPKGLGEERWHELLNTTLVDCRAILVAGIGDTPRRILKAHGIRVLEMEGLVSTGLQAIYRDEELRTLSRADYARNSDSCPGDGAGCG
jgi:nitrogen fixation protein NifB